MKTATIRYAVLRLKEDGSPLASMIEVELEAIEKEIAEKEAEIIKKDNALNKCAALTMIASSDPNNAGAEDVALIKIKRICIAAMSNKPKA